MDIQPIGNNKFIVGLSRDDMAELDITYDEMDYSNIETRRVIWTILDTVRKSIGRDVDPSGNLVIEAAPAPEGGCLLMFTISNGFGKKFGTVISKTDATGIFEFENADNLLDCLKQLPKDKKPRLFTDGLKFRIELSAVDVNDFNRVLGEYGKFIGKDSLTVAYTHEHWERINE